jgi:glycosyltransferase involved in cell wall biosynthesis
VADGPVAAAALRGLPDVIYCAHNLESSGFRGRGLGSPRALAHFERRLLAGAAEAWMVSEADIDGARRLCPGARLRYVPNVVDTDVIRPVDRDRRGGPALLVADFSYPPNRRGYEWLAGEVLPRVPAARLVVAGRGLDPAAPDARIDVRGFVPDLEALYAEAACAVVPLLEGGGSPLKFVEALAHGLPVVATPAAARGLAAEAGVHYLAGEDPGEFAAALERALAGDAADVGARGRRLAEERYSIAALAELLAA